jgi:hypothetical protein
MQGSMSQSMLKCIYQRRALQSDNTKEQSNIQTKKNLVKSTPKVYMKTISPNAILGACQSCDCTEYRPSRRSKCFCNCLSTNHVQLEPMPGMFGKKVIEMKSIPSQTIESITYQFIKKQLMMGTFGSFFLISIGILMPNETDLLFFSTIH